MIRSSTVASDVGTGLVLAHLVKAVCDSIYEVASFQKVTQMQSSLARGEVLLFFFRNLNVCFATRVTM